MRGRLNIFQKSMLAWNDLHPYNAVHVVQVSGALEIERFKAAVATVLEGKGLTGLNLDRGAGGFEYEGGAAGAEIQVIAVEAHAGEECAKEIERQLNTPFPQNQRFSPFRFFVVAETESFS